MVKRGNLKFSTSEASSSVSRLACEQSLQGICASKDDDESEDLSKQVTCSLGWMETYEKEPL